MLAEYEPYDVRPKFLKSVGGHASGETFRRAQKRVLRIGFAVDAPGVREEVFPKIAMLRERAGRKLLSPARTANVSFITFPMRAFKGLPGTQK